MIIVRTTLKVFPEKQLEVIQTLLSLIEPVGGEPGCNSCCAFCDIKDKHRLILLEEWETQKDLDQHIQSLRFGVLLGTRPLLCEPPQIQIHTVSRTRGMETVHAIRQNKEE
jgi:quinol monooxygenase YgiN